jgi:glutaminase
VCLILPDGNKTGATSRKKSARILRHIQMQNGRQKRRCVRAATQRHHADMTWGGVFFMDISELTVGSTPHEIERYLATIYTGCKPNTSGKVANYIPELAATDPDQFGISIATVDGRMWSCGDASAEFTIQSVSKAFTYCIALELVGRQEVFSHVGVEPSGDAFNAIIFDPHTNRPFNPMVNAGAITVSSLIHKQMGDGR